MGVPSFTATSEAVHVQIPCTLLGTYIIFVDVLSLDMVISRASSHNGNFTGQQGRRGLPVLRESSLFTIRES